MWVELRPVVAVPQFRCLAHSRLDPPLQAETPAPSTNHQYRPSLKLTRRNLQPASRSGLLTGRGLFDRCSDEGISLLTHCSYLRMVARMNLTHTVGDIRNFINASRPENLSRPYTIGTTFPNRTLGDDTATIQAAGLVNSVIVQRWA